jgi:excinuclease ABC subunit C
MTASAFDSIPGIGPARRKALLQHFGSPERFLGASREELEAVPGLPGKVARDIHAYVNKVR